jgi:hypothetical protein
VARPFRLSLTIRLCTPLSSGAAGAGAVMADKVVVRNGLGEYIVPGSQLRGTLRHTCERLLRALGPMDILCHGPRPEHMCPRGTTPLSVRYLILTRQTEPSGVVLYVRCLAPPISPRPCNSTIWCVQTRFGDQATRHTAAALRPDSGRKRSGQWSA